MARLSDRDPAEKQKQKTSAGLPTLCETTSPHGGQLAQIKHTDKTRNVRTRRSKLFLFPFFQKEKKETLENRRKLPPPRTKARARAERAVTRMRIDTYTPTHACAHTLARERTNTSSLKEKANKRKQFGQRPLS